VNAHLNKVSHTFPIRVYYEDTDAGGIVYHASHVRFLERGRTEYLRSLGIDQSVLMAADQGKALLFVVRRMELDYLKPARLDDMLTVTTKPIELTGVRLVLDQTLERNHDLILKARVIVAAIGNDGRPTRMPADIKARLLHGENG
jgi:acyl-CoA thioester hydrolase